ncbi:MAG: fumarylacetoacetate hydrolase [Candidatus Roseilinea sp.]|nr:MAG: fumarylacetoacetate hydrolase [Candidatus Roseilinea sp.]
MRLVQFLDEAGRQRVGVPSDDGSQLRVVREAAGVYELALEAARSGRSLGELVARRLSDEVVSYDRVIAERRILPPFTHPEPARLLLSGTGLNHLGSALARNAMHAQAHASGDAPMKKTDSLILFEWGLAGGKPAPGEIGSQPEWFYKGDGSWVTSPEQPLLMPPWALDGGEEAELAGLYVIGDDGEVLRVGFALANEFSDHVMERQNYLYLAHSKLRPCSFGPEVLLGDIPTGVTGEVRVRRGDAVIWAESFATGEANMSHTIANIEHHHFKYAPFRRPGDAHVHFFGASALSCAAGVTAQPGDVFEIESPLFGRPLRNPLMRSAERNVLVRVRVL